MAHILKELEKLEHDEVEKERLMAGQDLESADATRQKTPLLKRALDLFCILLNIVSTVLLVFLNNWYDQVQDRAAVTDSR